MGPSKITGFDLTPRFRRDYKKAPIDVQKAVDDLMIALLANPDANRCHGLHGYKPTVYAVDVFSNHSWQLTFEMNETVAVARRVARHAVIDDSP